MQFIDVDDLVFSPLCSADHVGSVMDSTPEGDYAFQAYEPSPLASGPSTISDVLDNAPSSSQRVNEEGRRAGMKFATLPCYLGSHTCYWLEAQHACNPITCLSGFPSLNVSHHKSRRTTEGQRAQTKWRARGRVGNVQEHLGNAGADAWDRTSKHEVHSPTNPRLR